MEKIKYENIINKVGVIITRDYPSTTAQTTTNYGYIFTPPFPFEVYQVIEKHAVAGTVSPVLDVLKVPNNSAISAGVSILASPYDLTSIANRANPKSGLDLNDKRQFMPYDSIALKLTGTTTTLEGVQVTIYIKPLNQGQFRNYS